MPSTNRRVKVDRDSLNDALAKVGLRSMSSRSGTSASTSAMV